MVKSKIFYLYKISSDGKKDKNVLIRCTREEFPNYSQTIEDKVNLEVESKKDLLLENYLNRTLGPYKERMKIDFLGEMQVDTFGDELFEKSKEELFIYIADTAYKFPWIAIGQADSEADFIKKMNDDDIYDTELGILSLKPKVETLRKLKVELITDMGIL